MKLIILSILLSVSTLVYAGDKPKPKPEPVITQPKDNWGGAGLHFGVSAIAGLACSQLYKEEPVKAFGCAMVPGTVKEIIDSRQEGNRFSTKDMIANALGAAVGVSVGNFYITPNQIVYQKSF